MNTTDEALTIHRSVLYQAAVIVAYASASVILPMMLQSRGLISITTMMQLPLFLWTAAVIGYGFFRIHSGFKMAGDRDGK